MPTAPDATQPSRYRLIGTLAVAGGAMLFASKGLLAKVAYSRGLHFETLVVIRAVLAMPLFWAFAFVREPQQSLHDVPPRALLAAAFAGVLCYYVGALTDFYALTLIDASVERVLLFSYPAMVVAIGSVMKRSLPARSVLLAVTLTYIGIFFTMGGFNLEVLRANSVGAAFVLISALTYAVYFMIGERFTRQIGSSRFTLIAMTSAAIALMIDFLFTRDLAELAAIDGTSWMVLGVLATVCMFVPALMQAEGIRRIGAQRGSVVSTAGPPTTILLGWLLLGERLSAIQFAGVALIVAGVLTLDLAKLRR